MDWKGLLWKIYFFLLILILGVRYLLSLSELNYSHYIDLLISILSLVGLVGLAFKKKIFSAKFWKVYFFVYLIWDFLFNIVIDPYVRQTKFNPTSLIGLVILIPLYIALYIYGFKFMGKK